MNKTAIKNFAVWARQKLISDITYKAGMLGITEKGIAEKLPQSTADLQFFDIGTKNYSRVSGIEIRQREALVRVIHEREHSFKSFKEAFDNTVEEVAYTWFNRLIAIRFMEVNDYLPSGIRVLSSENKAKNEPDFVTTPFDTDLDFTSAEQDKIIALKDENKLDQLFRMLFIKQCNKLNSILPELFEKTDDYTELLLNISFTDKDGVVYHLVHDVDEDDFNVEKEGQVEIIGWMYQYYNTEPKDKVFTELKKNIKISKDKIPAATQLFTPHWIVQYMVENSLGRLWLERNTAQNDHSMSGWEDNNKLRSSWKYYLNEAEQEPEVEAQLNELRKEYKNISPEDIRFLDPCMGSGHILVYAFEVFMQIYESCGYTQREAAKSVLANNLYGLDIDKRAYQLSYFALMMKARQYNRRIFKEGIRPNVFYIRDNSALTADTIEYIAKNDKKIKADLRSISNDLNNATEYGSLISVTPVDFDGIYKSIEEIQNGELDIFGMNISEDIIPVIKQAEILSQKYDIVVTNPPYMGGSGMNMTLSDFVKKNYPDSKSDLFACFIEQCGKFAKKHGHYAMITQHAWMFLSSYEKLREKLASKNFVNMAHLGARAFDEIGGEVVQTTTFVHENTYEKDYFGVYVRLVDIAGEHEKENMFLNGENRYTAKQENFSKIPSAPVAYWVSENFINIFCNKKLGDYGKTCQGLATGDNNRFLRLWYECDYTNVFWNCRSHEESYRSLFKWYPCTKGGSFRRWYGNIEYVVNWYQDGYEIKKFKGSVIRNIDFYFKKAYTWSTISSGKFSMRYAPVGSIFESKGSKCFIEDKSFNYVLGLLNTCVTQEILSVLAPTLDYHEGPVSKIPIKFPYINSDFQQVHDIVEENIKISKIDWDSFETSWDFNKHPLV